MFVWEYLIILVFELSLGIKIILKFDARCTLGRTMSKRWNTPSNSICIMNLIAMNVLQCNYSVNFFRKKLRTYASFPQSWILSDTNTMRQAVFRFRYIHQNKSVHMNLRLVTGSSIIWVYWTKSMYTNEFMVLRPPSLYASNAPQILAIWLNKLIFFYCFDKK